jgi:hypothetical protein
MSIRFVCECGKEFEAKDEFAGKKAICPACKRDFRFAVPSSGESENSPNSVPMALTQIATRDARSHTGRHEADPPTHRVEHRPFWKDPIVVIGAAIPSLILLAFFIYLYHEHSINVSRSRDERLKNEFRSHIQRLKSDADALLKSGKPTRAAFEKYEELLTVIGNSGSSDEEVRRFAGDVKKERDRLYLAVKVEIQREEKERLAPVAASPAKEKAKEKPAPIAVKDMPESAKFFMRFNIALSLEKSPTVESYKILNMDVRRAENDERKIEWLWESMTVLAVTYKQPNPQMSSRNMSTTWKSLFQCTPSSDGVGECWREVIESRSGVHIRKHFESSEWTKAFRAKVSAAWLQAVQGYERQIKDDGMTESEKRELLQETKQGLAQSLRITTDELHEILEATD